MATAAIKGYDRVTLRMVSALLSKHLRGMDIQKVGAMKPSAWEQELRLRAVPFEMTIKQARPMGVMNTIMISITPRRKRFCSQISCATNGVSVMARFPTTRLSIRCRCISWLRIRLARGLSLSVSILNSRFPIALERSAWIADWSKSNTSTGRSAIEGQGSAWTARRFSRCDA